MMLLQKDTEQLEKIGIRLADLERQIELITNGMEQVKIVAPATTQNGIIKITDDEINHYLKIYEHPNEKLEVVKFVPASGAATRMFKDLIEFFNTKSGNNGSETFFSQLEKFPFYEQLKTSLPEIVQKTELTISDQLTLVERLLHDKTFNFSKLPKGMIPFHVVNKQVRTAFEEHLREAINHSGENKNVGLHFTVALSYRDKIKELLSSLKDSLDGAQVTISFSLQSQSTNTIALNAENEMVRDSEDHIFFRPGGHGSLLNNLNNIHADLIFIRNIDNVIPEENKKFGVEFEKVMAGFLLDQKHKRDKILLALEEDASNENVIQQALDYVTSTLINTCPPKGQDEASADYIKKCLNRPMRVCGMVKNVGEPGGGPFFVKKDGEVSLQIVETSQIDEKDPDQQAVMKSATHFNPVDLVCATRDHHSNKYNLMDFRDVDTSFIASKTYEGQPIKALEWPGLWNGAMYDWITFFMEIPLDAFNPVKTVNDLLRKNHQPMEI